MEKAKRGELLRQRMQKLFPVVMAHRPASTRPRVQPKSTKVWRGHQFFVPELRPVRADPKWVREPDELQPVNVSTKHAAGVPALVKIAEKAPAKLTRRHATAEAYLASRAPR